MSCNCKIQTGQPCVRVLDVKHRVGGHVELKKTLLQTLNQPSSTESHCVQFYLGSAQGYSCRTLDLQDIEKSKAYCEMYGKTFYVHCPLIANLSKDPKTKEESEGVLDPKDREQKEKDASILERSWKVVASQVNQLNGFPAGCVLHMGSKGTVNHLIENLNDFNVPRNNHISQQRLLNLENAAGQGSSIGRSFDEIRKIFEGIDRNTIGLCMDTQHTFAAGTSSLNSHEDIVKFFDEIEAVKGGEPDVIHLNDSKKAFKSQVDRHECITEGFIWSEEKEGLRYLLERCYESRIDCILETPDARKDLDLIRSEFMDLCTIDCFTKKMKGEN
jgi:deoxyribonuclease-4